MTKVLKAVIPAAGWGTRFLPFTKAVPKEMLPIIDRPAIQHIVEEAAAAGLRDVLMVLSPQKKAIEDHFDRMPELELLLAEVGKDSALSEVRSLVELVELHSVRQHQALGLGHAVGRARHHVGDEAFAVLLGDDMMHPSSPLLREMIRATEEHGSSTIALMRVPPEEISLYGAATVEPLAGPGSGTLVRVLDVVEKPVPEQAPSDLAVIGRYVFTPEIFDHIEQTRPGAGGEIQLTDAIAGLAQASGVNGYVFEGGRYDVGSKLDYLRAVLDFALERDELREGVRQLLTHLAEREGLT